MTLITLPYPARRDEIRAYINTHHYTRRCPAVWSMAYAIESSKGKLRAVAVYGPPPYPSVARAFCRDQTHTPRVIWQARMVATRVSGRAEIDALLAYANRDLEAAGFWWVVTLTDPVSKIVEGAILPLVQKAFAGDVYQRNGWLYTGTSGERRKLDSFLIDGQQVHIRQGATTLTKSNVRQHYPAATNIRALYGNPKQRWVYVLGNSAERAQRILLMKYRVLPVEVITQPHLLVKRWKGGFAWQSRG